jgi:NAD(P)-dependent dehydrogenase (short-subunit alcohol dehydrogenase family)
MRTIQELFDLSDRVAVVAGGAGLLGFQMSCALAEAGAQVVIADVRQDLAEQKAAEIKSSRPAVAIGVNAHNYDSVVAMKDAVVAKFGRIDILVNSIAGGTTHAPEDFPPEEFSQSIHANLTAVFYLCQVVGKQMLQQRKGSIISLASMYGVVVPYKHIYEESEVARNSMVYGVAKAGLIQMHRYLATAWIDRGVRVNCISPGYTRTPLVDQVGHLVPGWLKDIPMGRMAEVTDLQGAVVYLACEASDHVTGHDLVIDGGYSIW